jgi:hypothetical protein
MAPLPVETVEHCGLIWNTTHAISAVTFDRVQNKHAPMAKEIDEEVLSMSASSDRFQVLVAVVMAHNGIEKCAILKPNYDAKSFDIISKSELTNGSQLSRPAFYRNYVAFEKLGMKQEIVLLNTGDGNPRSYTICDYVPGRLPTPSPPILVDGIAYLKKRDSQNEIARVRVVEDGQIDIVKSKEAIPNHKEWVSKTGIVYFMNGIGDVLKISGTEVVTHFNRVGGGTPVGESRFLCNGRDLICLYSETLGSDNTTVLKIGDRNA